MASDPPNSNRQLPTEADPDIVAKPYLRRVVRWSKQLIGGRFESARALWQFQLDLLNLQREIQAAIGQRKASPKDRQLEKQIARLEDARWHARRLGDAIAWVLLHLDRRSIHALAKNNPTPVAPQDDHGSRGVIAIAEYLAGQGWGFPDITDCLRVGDVTFVQPEKEAEVGLKTLRSRLDW